MRRHTFYCALLFADWLSQPRYKYRKITTSPWCKIFHRKFARNRCVSQIKDRHFFHLQLSYHTEIIMSTLILNFFILIYECIFYLHIIHITGEHHIGFQKYTLTKKYNKGDFLWTITIKQ